LCYARTDEGLELPVVDITHPAFAETISPAELAALANESLRRMERGARVPRFLQRLFARRSILMRGSLDAAGSFASGMTTYFFKLGPQNLGSYASELDRKVAGAITPVCVRIRLRDLSTMLADALRPLLSSQPNRPLRLLNIGGGPAPDSLNTLLQLQKEQPELLAGRAMSIHVLDIDEVGPRFGARALAALLAPGAPLHGLDIRFEHVPYDWSEIEVLQRTVRAFGSDGALVAASSEGGLFEYASDSTIVANLVALRDEAPPGLVFATSLLRDDPIPSRIRVLSKTHWRSLGSGDLEAILAQAGWSAKRSVDSSPLYRVLLLARG
jgi:hypothetical protein